MKKTYQKILMLLLDLEEKQVKDLKDKIISHLKKDIYPLADEIINEVYNLLNSSNIGRHK